MVCAAKSQHTIKAMVGAWPPSQIKLLNLHRQNALQANREKQETMQTTHSFDKHPNALSGFNAPKNKEGLVAVAIPTPHKHSLSCTTCKNKPTNRLQTPRKPNNSQMRQLINPSTHKLINPSTHKLINSKTHQLINSSTQKLKLLFFILQQRSIFRAILAKIWGKK